MENRKAIEAKMEVNRKRIEELTDYVTEHAFDRTNREQTGAMSETIRILKMENLILKDNLRRVVYADVIPTIIEVLNKYEGKSYGPKTKDKIYQEIKKRTKCSMYIEKNYASSSIHITPLNEQGYTDYTFKYQDFIVTTPYNVVIINENNKLEHVNLETLYLQNCPKYVDNVTERAQEILTILKPAVEEQKKALENAISELNSKLPSGIDNVTVPYLTMHW